MKLRAIIEQIDRQSITVEYVDPFDHGSYRVCLDILDDLDADSFEIYVMQHFPLHHFKRRHHVLTRELPESHERMVATYTGKTLELDAPEAPDAPVVD